MKLWGGRKPRSIFVHTLLLVTSVVLVLGAANVALVLFRPPPTDLLPFTAYEVARLLRAEPIAKQSGNVRVTRVAQPPFAEEDRPNDRRVRTAIAHYLSMPASDVRFVSTGLRMPGRFPGGGWNPRDFFERQTEQEFRLYHRDGQFNPGIFGSFRAAAKLRDGSWRVIARERRDPIASWRTSSVLWIVGSVLLVLPIAWLFSLRLARPIRAFAMAADQLGRHQEVEPVRLRGPAEIQRAAMALNEMQARLKRYIAERTSMVGAIAHDLRTPLSRLNFHLATAPDAIRNRAEAEIAEMENMISVTLDFVQNETSTQPHEPVDLGILVASVVDDFADMGHDAAMEGTPPAVTVNGDSMTLKRLFANLIRNAVYYGDGARVAVNVRDRSVIVDVMDDGDGLAPDDLVRVFEPFYRVEHSRSRETGGMGLGLAIVESAVRAHGGHVELFNRPEGGLCARVTLPIIT